MLIFATKLLQSIPFVKRTILFIVFLISCRCVPVNAQANSDYKFKTIVLDAGHGGHDTGCRGVSSYEKNVTLALVLKLGALIKKTYPGIKIIYTRQTDTFIELYERANIANRANADLFISIHCNASKSISAYGTETWLMGLHKSEGNLEVSKRENDVIMLEDNYQENYDGFDPNSPEGYIILSMNQNAHIDQSINLASKVEDEFVKDGRQTRGVKQAGFLVLWRTTMPSILIESGFLTNREEEKYLNSTTGQNQIALSVLQAIALYKSEIEGDYSQLALVQQDSKTVVEDTSGKPAPVESRDTLTGDQSQKMVADANIKQAPSPVIVYKIQIAASEKSIPLNDPRFAGIKDITNDKSDNQVNRYVVGNYTDLTASQNRLATLRKNGFKDAFVVAYKDGKRIPISELP
ncbi:MAG: N-acetylmuramoyl-L-alanine amidase [Chitinophagaceae bacterium]|nr:N-acetylmuramoyl-L-alanine amidase [Chitinophagaceae bacterium]